MTRGNFSHRTLVFAAVCLVTVFQSVAQGTPKPKHLKSDQLLTEALAENGFGTAVSSPWHVRANFETFDEKGKHKGGGTFEEWWAGPRNYKTVFTGETFNQTDVATQAGLFRSGDQRWADVQEDLVQKLIVSPMSVRPYDPRRHDLIDENRANGASKMRCVFLLRKPAPDERAGSNLNTDLNQQPSYCFEPDSTLLRYSSSGPGYFVVFNDVVDFHSHFAARSIQKMAGGKPYLTIHVLEINPLPADTAAYTAPHGSSGPLGGRIVLPEGRLDVVGGSLDLAPAVLRELATTELSVKLVIGKDGHVIDSTTLSAPQGLQATVAKAARKLIFAPFTILDTPVEVETTFDVNLRSSISMGTVTIGR